MQIWRLDLALSCREQLTDGVEASEFMRKAIVRKLYLMDFSQITDQQAQLPYTACLTALYANLIFRDAARHLGGGGYRI